MRLLPLNSYFELGRNPNRSAYVESLIRP
jgi:hypothetical protein